ncbi:MAG: hypothetical protein AAFO88_09365, partial [Pseudomonadota bacterium]
HLSASLAQRDPFLTPVCLGRRDIHQTLTLELGQDRRHGRFGQLDITPSETDRRQKWVTLSEAGRKVHSAALERLEPALQTLIDAIGEARLKAIHPLLVEFRTFLDEARNLRDFGAQRPKPSDP